MRRAKLILNDGSEFCGWSFGADHEAVGEVVFNTAMTGYPESLTDPSYAGQMMVMTYPLVGNYGVPSTDEVHNGLPLLMESGRIHVAALIVADYSEAFSHWNATQSLAAWLQREGVPAITGIDTRRLTLILREHGVMMGKIVIDGIAGIADHAAPSASYEDINWVAQVSCKDVITYKPETVATENSKPKTVVLVDCGVKANIIRCLLKRGLEVIRVPWDYDFNQLEFDGLFLTNGPGDPAQCEITVEHIRTFLETESKKVTTPLSTSLLSTPLLKEGAGVVLGTGSEAVRPCMGICLGNQLLAKAAGATTYKLKYGHRSHNQPVQLIGTNRCFITSQNHGYAVDDSTLSDEWQPLFVNMNDGSNEGICHKNNPWFSVQFHPEACSGPVDTEFLFDRFADMIEHSERLEVMGYGLENSEPQACPDSPSQTRGGACRACEGAEGVSYASHPLPQKKPQKVLLLGSGALKIGQAGEFDYSGAQALKAMREEGVKTVLINPNIATVQTSHGIADKVYFLPVQPHFVERVIAAERPDGILLAFGGQTALNCGVELYRSGILKKYDVEVLGTPIQAIIDTEDRDLFVKRLDEIGVKTISSKACNSPQEVRQAAAELGFPVILRAAYALGGLGSGFCDNDEELSRQTEEAFSFSPQVLVEKSLRGWKEIEYEVVRDRYDNCITVCNMENFDPLGIHTGESIVVAPSQTLSNAEYHKLRALSIQIIRHLGIVGECNVQYALDPASEDYRVIEVNARLSRSSALASKATGYPLAFVAAKLALGYGLFHLKNAVTKTTTAFFEPALDYVVCKIPRWDLSKFQGVSHQLGSSMKSVGEIMAIGRTFEEALQKGLRMTGTGMHGFVENKAIGNFSLSTFKDATDNRIFAISQAMQLGYSVEQIHEQTKIDRWFLHKLKHIIALDQQLRLHTDLAELCQMMEQSEFIEMLETTPLLSLLRAAKVYGFSDFQIARALQLRTATTDNMEKTTLLVRQWRKELGIAPVVNQIDTLAAEYPAKTNYLYLTYL